MHFNITAPGFQLQGSLAECRGRAEALQFCDELVLVYDGSFCGPHQLFRLGKLMGGLLRPVRA
jgi:hypothetical protein